MSHEVGGGELDDQEKIPFIKMFYVEHGQRKIFECNWPEEFIKVFGDKNTKAVNTIEIFYFFVMGQQKSITTLESAIKFCKA